MVTMKLYSKALPVTVIADADFARLMSGSLTRLHGARRIVSVGNRRLVRPPGHRWPQNRLSLSCRHDLMLPELPR
jgi:hypothetical protein